MIDAIVGFFIRALIIICLINCKKIVKVIHDIYASAEEDSLTSFCFDCSALEDTDFGERYSMEDIGCSQTAAVASADAAEQVDVSMIATTTPVPRFYIGPALFSAQPPPPEPASVAAASFTYPPPPVIEFFVGPAWFDASGPPPLPFCVVASKFSYPPPPLCPLYGELELESEIGDTN